jgi:hypothetical protein
MKTIPEVNLLPWRVFEEREKMKSLLFSFLLMGLFFFGITVELNRYFSNRIESLTKENADLSAKISTSHPDSDLTPQAQVNAKRVQAFVELIGQAKAFDIRLSSATGDFGLSNSLHFSGQAETGALGEWTEKSKSLLSGAKLQVTELRKTETGSTFEAQVIWREDAHS